jgi:hypothetical protein
MTQIKIGEGQSASRGWTTRRSIHQRERCCTLAPLQPLAKLPDTGDEVAELLRAARMTALSRSSSIGDANPASLRL